MAKQFEGKHVLITGGGNGIGWEIANQFQQEGAHLSIFDYNEGALNNAKEAFQNKPTQAWFYQVDVSDREAVDRCVAEAEKNAPIDILVNNAGICIVTPFLNISQEEWQKTLDIDLTGVFNVAQSVCRFMAKRKKGVVINMSSKNGLDAEFGHAHYNASKAGVIMLTKTIAVELGHLGIRANAVCPGYVRTPINLEVDSDEFVQNFADRYIPIDRVGTTREIAPMFLFLAREDSSYINGQTFVIDGGQLSGQKPGQELRDEIDFNY